MRSTDTFEVDRKKLVAALTMTKPDARPSRNWDVKKKSFPVATTAVELLPRQQLIRIDSSDWDRSVSAPVLTDPIRYPGVPICVDYKALKAVVDSIKTPVVRMRFPRSGDRVQSLRMSDEAGLIEHHLGDARTDTWVKVVDVDEKAVVPLAPNLIAGIKRVMVAASPEDFRPVLNGICFDRTMVVATDSYRLAYIGPYRFFGSERFVIPLAPLKHLFKQFTTGWMVRDPEGVRTQMVDVNGLSSSFGTPANGQFPNWRRLLPTTYDTVTFDRLKAIDIVTGLKPLVQSDTSSIRMHLTSSSVEFSVYELPKISSAAKIDAEFSGDEFKTAYNPQFLLDGLTALTGPQVTLRIQSSLQPSWFVDGDFGYVLMPIRVPGWSA